MKLKKAISPVVATALLLVVAVVAVVSFQNWFTGFQSGLNTDVEQRSKGAGGSINIEFISDEGVIYITNTGSSNVSMSTIKIGDTDCLINQNLTPGVNNISVASCLESSGTNEVILLTGEGVIQETLFVEEINFVYIPPLDCSALGLAGGEWIAVPGNAVLGTSDFCVMKYEAKDVGGVATSQELITPWTSISQANAKTECESLGDPSKYHLITNAEWTTIARNIEQQTINWADGVIGSTIASGGGLKRGNIGILDSASYNGADPEFGSSRDVKAMLTLSNGENIWDFSGNVFEVLNDTCLTADWDYIAGWYEWDSTAAPDLSDNEKNNGGPIGSYNSSYGVGQYIGCSLDNNIMLRGGTYISDVYAGIYAIYMNRQSFETYSWYGFRCTYTP